MPHSNSTRIFLMIVNGFSEAVISVESIPRICDTLSDLAGWTVTKLPDAPVEQFFVWHVPDTCTRIEQVLLTAENDTKGFLRLVKFHGCADAKIMRSSQRSWDTGGIFDLNVYVHDIDKVYSAMQKKGWTAFGDPVDYAWGGFEVRETVALSPDGFGIGMLQPYGKILIELPEFKHMSRAFNSAQIVRNFEESLSFYINKLGWKTLVNESVKDALEPGQEVLGIPSPLAYSVERKVAILHPQGTNEGGIELIEMSELKGRDFSEDCVAPNIGHLALRFPVDNVGAYAQYLKQKGVDFYTPLTAVNIAPYGKTMCFSLRSPDGVTLEFYEIL